MTPERRIEVEVEVPVTPEQAWEAIATGPGISAWFMPADVEPRVGGAIVHHHEVDLETTGRITAYDAPQRFEYEEAGWLPDHDHATHVTATEWMVEARSGGTCAVRLVMSGFGDGEAWDRAMESFHAGWTHALLALRIYLTHFPGERASAITVGGAAAGDDADAVWRSLTDALGLPAEPAAGDHVAAGGPGVPPFAGTVQESGDRVISLVLDAPARGIGFVGCGGPGEQVFAFVRAQLFGEGADEVAARDEPAWRAWFAASPLIAAGAPS